jgi:hypothetical protein
MAEETLELRVDLKNSDFKKLEKGIALELANGFVGGTPIKLVIQREKKVKTKLEWKDNGKRSDGKTLRVANIVEDKDSAKILSIIGTSKDDPKKRRDIVAEAKKRWNISPDKTAEEIIIMLREGTIYEPREGWLRKT